MFALEPSPLDGVYDSGCRRCALFRGAKTVCMPADRAERGLPLVLAQNPGYSEDRNGKPFVGRSGQLLDAVLARTGLPRERVCCTNAVKCTTPKDVPPTLVQMKACNSYLWAEVDALQPVAIL